MSDYPGTLVRSTIVVAEPKGSAVKLTQLWREDWGGRLATHLKAARHARALDDLSGIAPEVERWIAFDVHQRTLLWPTFAFTGTDLGWLASRGLGISFDQVFVGDGGDEDAEEDAIEAGRVATAVAMRLGDDGRRRRVTHHATEPDTALRRTLDELEGTDGWITSVSMHYFGPPAFATTGFEIPADVVATLAGRASRLVLRQAFDDLSAVQRRRHAEALTLQALERESLSARALAERLGMGNDSARVLLRDLASRGVVANERQRWQLSAAAPG